MCGCGKTTAERRAALAERRQRIEAARAEAAVRREERLAGIRAKQQSKAA